jgi:hypothetical protein
MSPKSTPDKRHRRGKPKLFEFRYPVISVMHNYGAIVGRKLEARHLFFGCSPIRCHTHFTEFTERRAHNVRRQLQNIDRDRTNEHESKRLERLGAVLGRELPG